MKDEGGILDGWKDRGLFALVAATLAGHLLWNALVGAGPSVPTAGSVEGDQRYVLAAGRLALPADADAVFARAEPDAYFDDSRRRVWVEPKAEEAPTVLRLDPPPPAIPTPPMLLPVPGPMLQFTDGLLRWPAAFLGEEEKETPEDGAAAPGADEAAPSVQRRGPDRARGAAQRRPPRKARDASRRPSPSGEQDDKGRRDAGKDNEELRERLRHLRRTLRETRKDLGEEGERGGEE